MARRFRAAGLDVHILHLIDTLEFGGAEKVMVALANGSTARHRVSVCCLRRLGPLAGELVPGIEVFSMGKGEGDDPGLAGRLASRMRDLAIDVVHTHNWSVFIEGGMAARRAGIGVRVHSVHGPYGASAPGLLARAKRSARHWLERRVARDFNAIVAVSDAARAYIPGTVGIPAARLMTIHNGIESTMSAAVDRSESTSAFTFIAVGRLDAIKNQALMLRAIALLRDQGRSVHLRLIGDGPERERLLSLRSELGLQDCVELSGFRGDVAELLASADGFLMSSRYEGISIALLEAMRAGLASVVTDVGGIPETVRHEQEALLVADSDLAGYAAEMARLIDAPLLRQRLGKAAQQRQQTEFSLATMLARYEALYNGARLSAVRPH